MSIGEKSLEDSEKSKSVNNEWGEVLYSFETPEFLHEDRGTTWFIGMGIGVLIGVLVGIFQDSLSLILVSITIGAVYTLTHNAKPKMVSVQFTDAGVVWRDTLYLYQHIKKFWILWEPGERKTLHLLIKIGMAKELVIPIHSQRMAKIRDVLGYYIPEVEGVKEGISDLLTRKLKL